MSTASDVIARAQKFVDEGQPYTFGGKNQAMNKGNKHIVESLRNTYGTGSGHYGHILGNDKTNTGMNYKKYVNADQSPYVFIDCSGLTDVAFKAGGINIGAGSSNQNSNAKNKVARIDPQKNPTAIKPGALLHRNGHVAVMGYDNKVIEAKGWKYGCVAGVTPVSSFTSAYNLSGSDGANAVQEQKKQVVKVIGKATIVNISSYLNVRPEAGTAKPAIGKLYLGNQVEVTGEAGDWYQILYNGQTAYISKKYANMNGSAPEKPQNQEQQKPGDPKKKITIPTGSRIMSASYTPDLDLLSRHAAQEGYAVRNVDQAANYVAKYCTGSSSQHQCTRGTSLYLQLASYARGEANRNYKSSCAAHLFGSANALTSYNISSSVANEFAMKSGSNQVGKSKMCSHIANNIKNNGEFVTFQYGSSQHIVFYSNGKWYSDFQQGTAAGCGHESTKFSNVHFFNR